MGPNQPPHGAPGEVLAPAPAACPAIEASIYLGSVVASVAYSSCHFHHLYGGVWG